MFWGQVTFYLQFGLLFYIIILCWYFCMFNTGSYSLKETLDCDTFVFLSGRAVRIVRWDPNHAEGSRTFTMPPFFCMALSCILKMKIMIPYYVLLKIYNYCSNETDVKIKAIAKTMSRDSFYCIQRVLHFANNDEASDKTDAAHD